MRFDGRILSVVVTIVRHVNGRGATAGALMFEMLNGNE
jgi:hypothetical protein